VSEQQESFIQYPAQTERVENHRCAQQQAKNSAFGSADSYSEPSALRGFI
jgi:hypothetical protein